jgi:hypothetical protein
MSIEAQSGRTLAAKPLAAREGVVLRVVDGFAESLLVAAKLTIADEPVLFTHVKPGETLLEPIAAE